MSDRPNLLGQAWLVLLLAVVFGAALAGVHTGLAPRIAANQRAEALREIPALVLGQESTAGASVDVEGDRLTVTVAEESRVLRIRESVVAGHELFEVLADEDGSAVGWVAGGRGPGYADEIRLLVGLDPEMERLQGLFVLAQKETPALGDGITQNDFRARFVGQPTTPPLQVHKGSEALGEGRIEALTAATISSRSVCEIVNRTVAEVRAGRNGEER